MDPTEITMINDLGLSNDNYTIKVRIIRLWKQTIWAKPHETRQIGMILMDEEGNKIECTVDKSYVILGQALEEYADVYIHKPTLGLYVDGVMKITLKLEDLEGRQVFATLWGDYAEQIDSYVSKHRGNFVMIIQCAKLKNHRGRAYVNNTYLATKLFIDEQVEEIIDFKKNLNEKESGSASSRSRATDSFMYTAHDDFLKNNPFYQISMIHELDEGSYAIILGTIKMFEDSQQWYYPACKNCKRKVQKMPLEQSNVLDHVAENESWVCTHEKCKGQIIVVEPSFMLKIRVQGLVGVVTLTLFDRDVRSILNISASDLIEKYENMGNIVGFPVEINELIGRKMAFKIIVKRYTCGRKYICNYNISKISDNFDIISALEKLEKANDIEQGSSSFVADNTPISTFPNIISMSPSTNHDTTSLLSPPTNAKRKLVDVYALEDTVCESSTKPSKKSIGVKESVVSTQLLIPKVEK
ncbi:unnamed protein product [Lactuca virosa]|uniref:Replication factor A C-terminal domain-containing protein n=1 Tax=Lactuca virosa TaxID=75947 RepID=A0AAU9M063_9ASTR|nr:unnamed protein product [Lactuca virosa]